MQVILNNLQFIFNFVGFSNRKNLRDLRNKLKKMKVKMKTVSMLQIWDSFIRI